MCWCLRTTELRERDFSGESWPKNTPRWIPLKGQGSLNLGELKTPEKLMKALDSFFFFSFFLEISMYVCWYKSVQTYIPIYTKYQRERVFTDFLKPTHRLSTPPSYRLKIPLQSPTSSLNEHIFALNRTTERNNTTRQKWQDPNLPNFSKGVLVNCSVWSTNLFRDYHNTWEVLVTQLIENTTNWQTGLSREH